MDKKEIVYTGELNHNTSLMVVKLENGKNIVVTVSDKKMTHICNLPDETFKLGEDAIAVFENLDGKNRLLRVYDLEKKTFIDKKNMIKVYDEKFIKNQKVKKKI